MVKRMAIALVLVLAFSINSGAAEWSVDLAHSSVGFSVKHMVISKVRGGFDTFEGTVNFDGENLDNASVEFSVDIASIDTENEKRDEHLRSADFFDAEKYPKMTFVSKSVKSSGNTFQLTGDLTMKDVTKEVIFEGEFAGTVADPWGNTRAGFSATTTIDRQQFNMTWGKVLETGGLMVGNDVEIQIELELIKK